MARPQKEPLRPLSAAEAAQLQRSARASSERHDRRQRAQALVAVASGASFQAAAQQVGYRRSGTVSAVVARFNQQGLAALDIAHGRGHPPTYGPAERARILAMLQRPPQRRADGTATWSLVLLERALRQEAAGLEQLSATTIREVLRAAGYTFQGTRVGVRPARRDADARAGSSPWWTPRPSGKGQIEQAYAGAEAAGVALCCQDEAGPYQTVPYPGASWEPDGHPARQPHEYERNGTAKLLTLFRPATGQVRAHGVTRAPNAVLHPWLTAEVEQLLATLPAVTIPEAERPALARWETWLGPSRSGLLPMPPLRLILVWDNLAGHLSAELVRWLFAHGVLPLYTPLSGSWLNMAESVQRILVRRALAGQHPQTPARDHHLVGGNRGELEPAPPPPSSGAACAKHGGSAPGCGAWVAQARRCPMAPQIPV